MGNENQNEGRAKDLGGKIKETAGDLLGDREMKREGQADQVEGKVQKGVGDAQESLKK